MQNPLKSFLSKLASKRSLRKFENDKNDLFSMSVFSSHNIVEFPFQVRLKLMA